MPLPLPWSRQVEKISVGEMKQAPSFLGLQEFKTATTTVVATSCKIKHLDTKSSNTHSSILSSDKRNPELLQLKQEPPQLPLLPQSIPAQPRPRTTENPTGIHVSSEGIWYEWPKYPSFTPIFILALNPSVAVLNTAFNFLFSLYYRIILSTILSST